MKRKFCWLSLIAMLINIFAYAMFILFLNGGYFKTGLWYVWIFFSVLTPFAPLVAKYFRVKNNVRGKELEIIAIVLSLFNFANVCVYGFNIKNGNLCGWAAMIICAIIYSKAIKELPKDDHESDDEIKKMKEEHSERINENNNVSEALFCRKCGSKLLPNSSFCSKCGTEVIVTKME